MADNNPQATMAGLKGILRWTLEQQANTSDGTTESKPVTEEDRAWLKEAMENMIDATDHLKDCVEILSSDQNDVNPMEQDDTVRQLQENALDKLMNIIDNIDFARDLGVIGGMEPLLLLLKHPKHSSLRWRAANVLGTVVQNSEVCQQWAYDKGALDVVLEQLETETNLKCSCKLFFALASLIRGFRIGMEHFINNSNGLNMLIDLIKNQTIFVYTNNNNDNNGNECTTTTTTATTDDDRKERQNLLRKILFLFHSILGNNSETKTLFQNSNNLELLTTVILPIVILCTGYVKLNANGVKNPVGLYVRDENEIMGNFQLNDVAQQTLLSFFKSNYVAFFDQIVSLHPKFFEELTTKLKELQKVEGEEAMYVEDEITRCQEILNFIPVFNPSKEWKKVINGQQIPGGLEMRTNFETGQTFARVMQ